MNIEQKEVIREFEIRLKEATQEGYLIPKVVFDIIQEIKDLYETV